MSRNSNTTHFKVGDLVRRKAQYLDERWVYSGYSKDAMGHVISVDYSNDSMVVSLIGQMGNFQVDPITMELVVDKRNFLEPKPPQATQVGGDHYKSLKIQPIDYICANGLDWCEGNIVKYITRWKQKGGVQDIDKVIHYAEMLKARQVVEHEKPPKDNKQ